MPNIHICVWKRIYIHIYTYNKFIIHIYECAIQDIDIYVKKLN